MKMTTNMSEDEILGRIKMGVNVDIKRSDGKKKNHFIQSLFNIFREIDATRKNSLNWIKKSLFRVKSFKALGVVF